MAEKRMFAKSIVLSDAFLDMPMSARCLYFTLSMFADDDGFVDSPKGIMRQCGASQDDFTILEAKKFIITFDTGVIVIRHWRINNYLRGDRYKETNYAEEKSQLSVDEKGTYSLSGIPSGIPVVDQVVYPVKNSIDKNSIDKNSVVVDSDSDTIKPYFQPTVEQMDEIVSLWNQQQCTADVRRIKPLGKRWNNTVLCIENDLDAFLDTIRDIDNQEFFQMLYKKNAPVTYDWFTDPDNYEKILDGNYKEPRKQAKTKFGNFEQRSYDYDDLEQKLLARGMT